MFKWWRNWWCGFGWHYWSPWSEPEPTSSVRMTQFNGQSRKCNNCNMKEIRAVTIKGTVI